MQTKVFSNPVFFIFGEISPNFDLKFYGFNLYKGIFHEKNGPNSPDLGKKKKKKTFPNRHIFMFICSR
jgi:hypothetical protein